MKHYFIDFENVSSAGIHGAKDLTQDCIVNIFYSQNAKNMCLEAVAELTKGKAKVNYRRLSEAGRNALDFELVSIMSATIGESKEGEYYIISNDKGYSAAIRCLQNEFTSCPITIQQANSIANTLDTRKNLLAKHMYSLAKEQNFDARLKDILTGIHYEKHLSTIKDVFKQATCKQDLYMAFIKCFGNQTGILIYKAIKSNYYILKDALSYQ